MTSSRSAVLLLAHGSPESAADVPEFMRFVTGGRPLPAEVIKEVQHRYSEIGRSPLLEITLRQAALLQQTIGTPVYVGMRNWKPFIADAIRQMAADDIAEAVAICLAPHNSRTSVGLYRKALTSALVGTKIDVHFVDSWHDQPALISAFAEKLSAAWMRIRGKSDDRIAVIFTAHSVPVRTIEEGDPYEKQARETANLVAGSVPELTGAEVRFAFQSQGMAREPWLGPTVEETILALKHDGYKGVLIQPIGFLCDHVEVLYDIDIVFKNFARAHGIQLRRTESLNDSQRLTAALVAIAKSARGTSVRVPHSSLPLA